MPSPASIAYYISHPYELRAIIQWKLWHNPVHERDESKECQTLKDCFYFLDMTSRSFASVIKELHPELLVPMCVFYLILRGLDTIEDDMTIALSEKDPILRNFHQTLEQKGWNYDGNHSKEKDRELLVRFEVVNEEFSKLKKPYQVIIQDITKRMGNGMADYCANAEFNANGVDTIKDYEKYCHYVAGLVGEGCTRLFVEAGLANPILLERSELHESMGQLLQQVNIIRDIREDWEEKRRFWPKEIWSKHVDKFEDLFLPENKPKALACMSEMVLNALRRADDCLYYLAGIREQSVFNFCAIPQTMAMATLNLCFQNYTAFERNVKITKGEACQNMVDSTQNLQIVCDVFRGYARKIHRKNDPRDPNFLNISIACGRIEQFIESIFPSQVPGARVPRGPKGEILSPEEQEKQKAMMEEAKRDSFYVFLSIAGIMSFMFVVMFGLAWFFGARFDLAFEPILSWFGPNKGLNERFSDEL